MAYEAAQPLSHTFVAAADLSAAQYHWVKLNSDGAIILCAANTDQPIGVLQDAPKSGDVGKVVINGITKLVTSATITPGAQIGTAASARALAMVGGTDTTKYVTGVWLAGSGGDGTVGTALVNCPGHRAS